MSRPAEAKPRIVFVDAPTYLPDSARRRFEEIGELVVHDDRPGPAAAVARARLADVLVSEWTALPEAAFEDNPRLRHVVLPTTGYGRVDIGAARRSGVIVSNTPDYCQRSVAEHAMGMVIALSKSFLRAEHTKRDDVSYLDQPVGVELLNHQLGVVGLGAIGSEVANIGSALGMRVVAYNRTFRETAPVKLQPLEQVLGESNFVIVCLAGSDETKRFLDRQRLLKTRRGAVIVGISGSHIFDRATLLELLESGHLLGVGIDGPADELLRPAPALNLLQTPDTGWYTRTSRERNLAMVFETIAAGIAGDYRFVVNEA